MEGGGFIKLKFKSGVLLKILRQLQSTIKVSFGDSYLLTKLQTENDISCKQKNNFYEHTRARFLQTELNVYH